jgi:hypothetical protein
MMGWIVALGNSVLLNIAQFMLGCMAAGFMYWLISRWGRAGKENSLSDLIIMAAGAMIGMLLPLGPYGMLPILAVGLVGSLRLYHVLPFYTTGMLFNTSIPFTQNNFLWNSIPGRVLLALSVGMAAGLLIKLLKLEKEHVIRLHIADQLAPKSGNMAQVFKAAVTGVYIIGSYLVLGAAANVLFHRYLFPDFITWVYSNPSGFELAKVFLTHNASTKPLFLVSVVIVNTLLDLMAASGLLLIFRIKGVIGYYAYLSLWVLLLMSSIFIL